MSRKHREKWEILKESKPDLKFWDLLRYLIVFFCETGGFFSDRAAQDTPPEPTWTYLRRVRKEAACFTEKCSTDLHILLS